MATCRKAVFKLLSPLHKTSPPPGSRTLAEVMASEPDRPGSYPSSTTTKSHSALGKVLNPLCLSFPSYTTRKHIVPTLHDYDGDEMSQMDDNAHVVIIISRAPGTAQVLNRH